MRRAGTALLILVAMVMAAAASLAVVKDWLRALGLRVGIAEYNARVNSRLTVHEVGLDLLTLTATVRGISIAMGDPSPLDAPLSAKHVSAKVRVWPLLQR